MGSWCSSSCDRTAETRSESNDNKYRLYENTYVRSAALFYLLHCVLYFVLYHNDDALLLIFPVCACAFSHLSPRTSASACALARFLPSIIILRCCCCFPSLVRTFLIRQMAIKYHALSPVWHVRGRSTAASCKRWNIIIHRVSLPQTSHGFGFDKLNSTSSFLSLLLFPAFILSDSWFTFSPLRCMDSAELFPFHWNSILLHVSHYSVCIFEFDIMNDDDMMYACSVERARASSGILQCRHCRVEQKVEDARWGRKSACILCSTLLSVSHALKIYFPAA